MELSDLRLPTGRKPVVASAQAAGEPRQARCGDHGRLQATSLPFIVAATQIGLQLGVVSRASAAGLVAAGLLSVVISPALGLVLLRREGPETATPRARPTPIMPVLTAEDRALSRASEVKPAA
jgi:hypothetical protein